MPTAQLRILETTDLHMALTGYDYLRDTQGALCGLAGLVPVISQARREVPQTLLFDNGDFLQGSPLADQLASQQVSPHPMIDAFNKLSYDAITLGNHEFNYGLQSLHAALEYCQAPVVSANIRTGPWAYFAAPWTILTRNIQCNDQKIRNLRIGVIGFVTPKVVDWDCPGSPDAIYADDIVTSALTHLPAMQRAGADVIVALCHAGIGSETWTAQMENPTIPLAALPEIDVVLCGHTHNVFPGPDHERTTSVDPELGFVSGTPTVMAGSHGSHLGIVDLALAVHGNRWRIRDRKVSVRPAMKASADLDLVGAKSASLRKAHATTRAQLSAAIAQTDQPMNSHFAAVGYDPTAAMNGQAMVAAVCDWIAQSQFQGLPIVPATSCFGTGGKLGPQNFIDIPGPDINRRHVAAIAPFNNPVCVVLRRGWQVRAYLERTSAYFNQITPGGGDQMLINPAIPGYQFETLFGLTYQFDLTRPAGAGRVVNLCYRGAAVLDDDFFALVTNGYRASGGGGADPIPANDLIHSASVGMAEALQNYLSDHGVVSAPSKPIWSFVQTDGAGLIFPTAPNACPKAIPLDLERLADDEAGFAQFRLTL